MNGSCKVSSWMTLTGLKFLAYFKTWTLLTVQLSSWSATIETPVLSKHKAQKGSAVVGDVGEKFAEGKAQRMTVPWRVM